MMRIRRLLFSPHLLMLMGSGSFRVIGNPVPNDATLKQATIDPLTGCVQLFIESAEFDEIPDGSVAPEHQAPLLQRVQDLSCPRSMP